MFQRVINPSRNALFLLPGMRFSAFYIEKNARPSALSSFNKKIPFLVIPTRPSESEKRWNLFLFLRRAFDWNSLSRLFALLFSLSCPRSLLIASASGSLTRQSCQASQVTSLNRSRGHSDDNRLTLDEPSRGLSHAECANDNCFRANETAVTSRNGIDSLWLSARSVRRINTFFSAARQEGKKSPRKIYECIESWSSRGQSHKHEFKLWRRLARGGRHGWQRGGAKWRKRNSTRQRQ